MCLFNREPKPAPPAPLTPVPAAPPPPPPVLPAPKPLTTDVNPQVRRARSKKEKNPMSQGTGALRIPLKNTINTGSNTSAGEMNI
tara:strand:- start:2723 stop:2977 length:255 start_codon:yes stop_codon:yes gene_type:complete